MKQLFLTMFALLTILFTSCDSHTYEEDFEGILPTHVLCTDGKTYTMKQWKSQGKEPIAVVFHTSTADEIEGAGYAVYLWDIPPAQFADSLNVKQNTSADITKYDGNMNTYHMLDSKDVLSPIAVNVFDIWKYQQSAFIPSVAEMKLLYESADRINPFIVECGGQPIPRDAENCWYWTSTEVEGQENVKAWLYSTGSGAFHETRKDARHKVRPIISLRY